MTSFLTKAGVALAVGGFLGAGTAAGFGVASAVSDRTSSATTSPSGLEAILDPNGSEATSGPNGSEDKPAHRHGWPRRALANRVEHGELTLKGQDGKPVVMDVQRGQVTAVSPTSITLKSEDGFTASYTVSSDTRVRVGGTKKAIGDVKVGNNAGVIAIKEGGTATARLVVVR